MEQKGLKRYEINMNKGLANTQSSMTQYIILDLLNINSELPLQQQSIAFMTTIFYVREQCLSRVNPTDYEGFQYYMYKDGQWVHIKWKGWIRRWQRRWKYFKWRLKLTYG